MITLTASFLNTMLEHDCTFSRVILLQPLTHTPVPQYSSIPYLWFHLFTV